jgi:biopolymer transport protein TolQ
MLTPESLPLTPVEMDHGGGILAMVMGSGLVVQSVLLILIALSVWSWAITIAKTLHFRRARAESKEFNDIFWESRNLTRIDDSARRLNASPLVQVFSSGYREFGHVLQDKSGFGQSESLPTVERALARAEFEEAVKLERGITFLATTASAAPFIGLFGTVWGIMNAFHGLSAPGAASTIQAVAPGISEALVATAIGLGAAIPAAVAFNYFTVAMRQFRESMNRFSADFLEIARQSIAR